MMDDRGVSEVVGYILTFSLITMTIAIVFTAGFSGLQDARQAEQVNNVKRAFDVMDDNFDKVQHQQAPSRTTEMKLDDGSIGIGDETRIMVRDTSGEVIWTITIRPIVYADGRETSIVYEGGAIFRSDGEAVVMLDEPNLIASEGKFVFPLVVTDGNQNTLSGAGTVLVAGEGQQWNVDGSETFPENAQIEIASPRADAWSQYFDETDGFVRNEIDLENDRIVYKIEGQLVVHRTRIGITLYR